MPCPYVVAPNVDLSEPIELFAIGAGLHHLSQGEVHPGIAVAQMAIEGFAILQFHKHRVALGSGQEA
jgi:hypothetical protein